MTALFGSQQISGSPDLQVPHGNLKSAAQIRILPDGSQSFFRHLFEHFVSAVHKKRIRRTIGSADPPAQLIQLGKPHIIRVMNDHCIDIWDIQSRLYDCRWYQYINVSIDKPVHDILQLVFSHLSMSKCHICLRHQLLNAWRHFINIPYFVIHIIYLSATGKFPRDCLPDQFLIIFHDIRLNRDTVHRWFL